MDEFAEKRKAGFVIRGGASVVDGLLISLPLVIIFRILGTEKDYLASIIYYLYVVYMIATKGATIGKNYFGLKVIAPGEKQVGLGKAFLREVLGKFLSSIIFSLGFFWVAWDKNKQGWHDKIAGTYVVRDREISKRRELLASILVWILPALLILSIFATIVLIAINPARQFEKGKESIRIKQESERIKQQYNYETP